MLLFIDNAKNIVLMQTQEVIPTAHENKSKPLKVAFISADAGFAWINEACDRQGHVLKLLESRTSLKCSGQISGIFWYSIFIRCVFLGFPIQKIDETRVHGDRCVFAWIHSKLRTKAFLRAIN